LSIAPDKRLEAILLVDQGDRNDLQVGLDVDIKVEHLPGKTYHGAIDDISERFVEFAPRSLSNKLGGELATVTDAEGRESLTSRAYQATVLLEEDARLLTPGMRGKARFVVAERSAWDWLWRYIRRTFHFRL
jgi:putative peptide zinc metalloprotease protein